MFKLPAVQKWWWHFLSPRLVPFTVGFLLGWLALFTGTVYASDCPPDDPSRADCQAAASTARNPLVPIAGGVLGGTVGGMIGSKVAQDGQGSNGGDGGVGDDTATGKEPQDKEPGDKKPEDPCQAAIDRFQLAKLNQTVLFNAYLSWKSVYQSLEDLYWKTSEAGYWSGVVDVGFLAGSVFGRPLADSAKSLLKGALSKKVLSDSLKQKLLEAALKSMLKGAAKDLHKYLDPAYFTQKQIEDVGKKYLQEMLKEQITTRIMQDYLSQGAIRAGGFDGATVKFLENVKNYKAFRDLVTKTYADHWANFLGDTISLYNAGIDALTKKETLEIIRSRLNAARDNIFKTEQALNAATDEMSLARDSYNHSLQSDIYQRYLRHLEFLKLPRQG
jgi:hypothetical protein